MAWQGMHLIQRLSRVGFVATLLFWILCYYGGAEGLESCSRIPTPGLHISSRLLGVFYLAVTAPTIQVCVTSCLHQKKCVSVNYSAASGQCELNYANTAMTSLATLTTTAGFIYVDINYIPQMLPGSCNTKPCDTESICTDTQTGYECTQAELCYTIDNYKGNLNVTKTGRTCQRWDSTSPHKPAVYPDNLPRDDPILASHANYCRPDGNSVPWCYTMDPTRRWEDCSVPLCKNS